MRMSATERQSRKDHSVGQGASVARSAYRPSGSGGLLRKKENETRRIGLRRQRRLFDVQLVRLAITLPSNISNCPKDDAIVQNTQGLRIVGLQITRNIFCSRFVRGIVR
jgi:hypothetical protein